MPVAIRIYLDGERAGLEMRRSTEHWKGRVLASARGAAQDAASEIKERGAADIASAGKFGSRWTTGLRATISESGGSIRINVTHAEPLFPVFAEGRTIFGKPLLWIPLSFATDAQGVRARDFPGRLFRVDRKSGGAPLLLAAGNGISGTAQPKYFAKSSITIPQKFHTKSIARDVARNDMPRFFRTRFKGS